MYTISEIAKIFNITTNKIRFYEKKGLLKPLRANESEYRKFNDEDILILQSILLYRSIGLPIKDIQSILENNDKENYLNHFNNQWELINTEIHRLNDIRTSLEVVIDKLYDHTDECIVDSNIFNIVNTCNDLYKLKNNWKDKWDFNNWAKTYDTSVLEDTGELKIYKNYNLILDSVYNTVISLNLTNAKILDIGVGTGNLSSKFLYNNYDIIGIDQSREMLSVAKQKHPNLKVRLGEFLKIPYSDNHFDIIVSTFAFHHLNTNEKVVAIKEMLRVLKDDGYIIIGDLMFENKLSEKSNLSTLSSNQILEIEDEYYSYIDFLEQEFTKFDMNLNYTKIDTFNFIITVH